MQGPTLMLFPIVALGWRLKPEFNDMTIWHPQGSMVFFKDTFTKDQAKVKCESDVPDGATDINAQFYEHG